LLGHEERSFAMARIIGLDVGSKRIGIAMSDELGILATPRGILLRKTYNKDAAAILDLVNQNEACAVVIGLPLSTSGTATDQTRKTQRFGEMLASRLRVPVEYWDERYTTVMAHMLGPADRDDEIAAAIILQGYLDSTRSAANPPTSTLEPEDHAAQ
jgi:putative Holliday junction resolvase